MRDNFISYSGKVHTRKYRRGALIRESRITNEGTAALFLLLCESLMQNASDNRRPTYIDICYIAGSGFVSMLNSPVSIMNTSIIQNSGSTGVANTNLSSVSVIFRVNVSSGQVLPSGAPQGSGNIYFVLKDASGEINGSVLAYVEDTTVSASSFGIASDEVYIIDWTLTVGNQPQQGL